MVSQVAVYLPVRNAQEWARKGTLPESVRLVAVDSGSSDDTVKELRNRGVEVLEAGHPRGRIDNWRYCLDHFAESDAVWMRWLFAGDSLSAESTLTTAQMMAGFPDARMVVGGYINDFGHSTGDIVRPVTEPAWLSPTEALQRTILEGNWFGPPLAVWMHREVVTSRVYDFGRYEWAADFFAAHSVAAQHGCLAVPVIQGSFCVAHRQFFKAKERSAQARLETLAVRLDALMQLRAFPCQTPQTAEIQWEELELQCWVDTFQRCIVEEGKAEYLHELTERVSARMAAPVLLSRLKRGMAKLVAKICWKAR